MATIEIRNLSFSYPLVNRLIRSNGELTRKEIPVFTDLSLQVDEGTRLGVIGRNGAGKTTLLKLVAGILPPTSGRIQVDGVVSPLLNVRLGMERELTGIENIWLRGAYMGKAHTEIEEKIPHIIEFAELGEFIHLPLDTYSAGMVARLAFSIVTSFETQILVIDESIGTGDKQFGKKAADRMREFVKNSNILLLATHNERLMKELCTSALNLETGEINTF